MTETPPAKLTQREDLVFGSTKSWVAKTSTAFRQWSAKSHCAFIHGYALTFSCEFECQHLDDRNWVVDFGGLKEFAKWLDQMFDHTTLVAEDDPAQDAFMGMNLDSVIDIRIVKAVGCEAISLLCFEQLELWLKHNCYFPRVQLTKFEVREHQGNSAYVRRKP